jgi:prevent-host-death family protein
MMVKTIGISDLRKDISAKVKEVHEKHTRYIIVQRSSPKAVLLSLEELEALEGMTGRKRRKETARPGEDTDSGQEVSYEDFFLKKLIDRLK